MNNIDTIRELILSSILRAHVYENINLNAVMNSGIVKEWFEHPAHQAMFEAMRILYDGGKGFDEAVIMEYMSKSGEKDAQGVMLSVMAHTAAPHSVVMEYVGILKEDHAKKLLDAVAKKIARMIAEGKSSEEITAQVQYDIDQNVVSHKGSATRRLSDVRKARLEAEKTNPVQRMKTGIHFIDTVLTDKNGRVGFRNEGLVFISGLKQSGKTYVLTRIIENVSMNHPVMFGSLEFGEDLYDENLQEQQNDQMFDGNIDNIYTFDSIYEVHAIAAEIRLMHKLHGIKLVALDSMLRITNNNPDLKTDERRISETFSILGRLSKELKIPVIVVVQSSKEDLKSSMISVKGSMNADHEAYVWFHMMKASKDPEDELRTIIWNKNKDTHKHPKQHVMFVPQTHDFYQVELDPNGNPVKELHKYRRPAPKIVYEQKSYQAPAVPQYEAGEALFDSSGLDGFI